MVDGVVEFCVPADFLSSCLIDCWEKCVEVFNYNCGFFYFSFKWDQFSLHIFAAPYFCAYILRITVSSLWINFSSLYNISVFSKEIMDTEAWHAAVHGVAKSQTWFSDWTTSTTKQKQTHKYRKPTYSYQRGQRQGRDKSGIWD